MRHTYPRNGAFMTTESDKQASRAAPAHLHETDIYNFAGWLTTRPGVMPVGATSDAAPMADAVGEYIKTFPERFTARAAPAQRDECQFGRGGGCLLLQGEPVPAHPALSLKSMDKLTSATKQLIKDSEILPPT
jgi:hypothetical protein